METMVILRSLERRKARHKARGAGSVRKPNKPARYLRASLPRTKRTVYMAPPSKAVARVLSLISVATVNVSSLMTKDQSWNKTAAPP